MTKKKNTPYPEELHRIGERLKEIRKERGYKSYEHIAFDLGMSRSAYWRLEAGSNFELKTLIKVCKQLNVSLQEFFVGIDVPKPEKKTSKKTPNKK